MIEDIAMSEIERALGAPWNPPKTPALRALYFEFLMSRLPEDALEHIFLIAGVAPDPVDLLCKETHDLRMEHSIDDLRALAKREMAT